MIAGMPKPIPIPTSITARVMPRRLSNSHSTPAPRPMAGTARASNTNAGARSHCTTRIWPVSEVIAAAIMAVPRAPAASLGDMFSAS